MKLFLCFIAGCEFEYMLLELTSHPEQSFDADYFSSFQHDG